MKSAYKYLLFLVTTLTVGTWLLSCSKDELGAPSINYIRITNPASSDSLVASANQGQMIAIIGSNLQSVRQVWFNDQKASVIPTFVTSSTVITRIPSQIPISITNKLKMIFAGGDSLLYDFKVDISKPLIDHVRSEYVNEGDSLFIYGDYFYAPLTVTLSGGVTAEILSLSEDAKTLAVKMPSGVQPGPLTITTNFGNKASTFWMQDNRNIILDFDHMSGTNGQGISQGALWHPVSGDFDYATASHSGVPSINGNYLFAPFGSGGYSAWAWSEIWTGNAGAPELDGTKNIPQEAFTNPKGYSLKFEINTLGSLTGAWFNIYMGNNLAGLAARGPVDGKANSNLYTWQPNLNTGGVWQTYTIPWSDFYVANNSFAYSVDGYDMSIVLQGPNSATVNYFAIDNVRVVPNK